MSLYLLSFRDETDDIVVAVVSSQKDADRMMFEREVAAFLKEKGDHCRCGRIHEEDKDMFLTRLQTASSSYRLELLS